MFRSERLIRRGTAARITPAHKANREDTQVENLCYKRQRGAARAREPALLTSEAMDGGAKSASSE